MDFKKLIIRRLEFLGYGNLDSDIWFIGMEEGFGGSIQDLKKRFNKTKNKKVIDIKEGMSGIKDHLKWFFPQSNLQKTWSKLILILLSLKNNVQPTNEQIKKYQRYKFGRSQGDHCSLDLMPLPCNNQKDWPYLNTGIEFLNSKNKYSRKIMPERIGKFKKLIKEHSPSIVIFYSVNKNYLKQWKEIIGSTSNLKKRNKIYFSNDINTKFFVIPHPNSRGLSNMDWLKISKTIKNLSNTHKSQQKKLF